MKPRDSFLADRIKVKDCKIVLWDFLSKLLSMYPLGFDEAYKVIFKYS